MSLITGRVHLYPQLISSADTSSQLGFGLFTAKELCRNFWPRPPWRCLYVTQSRSGGGWWCSDGRRELQIKSLQLNYNFGVSSFCKNSVSRFVQRYPRQSTGKYKELSRDANFHVRTSWCVCVCAICHRQATEGERRIVIQEGRE